MNQPNCREPRMGSTDLLSARLLEREGERSLKVNDDLPTFFWTPEAKAEGAEIFY